MNVLDSIIGGHCDHELDHVEKAVRLRREILASRLGATIKKGDQVRFIEPIRPQYLVGATATVLKVNAKSVSVKLDDPPTSGRFHGPVRCPLTLVEKIER